MQRFLFWALVFLLSIGLCALLYLKFTLPQEDSDVYLKDGPKTPISGYVTKKDNYIIVAKAGSEQVFPWAEVKSISGPKPLASKSSAFAYWLDKLDFLSSLGVLAALVVFSAGLYQYQQGLLWKREEFLSARVKAFGSSHNVGNAARMLESLTQYEGITIAVYPEKKEANESDVQITNQEITDSLIVPIGRGTHAARLRENFDTFLDYFEALDNDIRLRVVEKKSVYVQLGYYLNLLGRHDKLRDDYRNAVIAYASHSGHDGFIRIIHRYNKGHRLWWWVQGKTEPRRVIESSDGSVRSDGPTDSV